MKARKVFLMSIALFFISSTSASGQLTQQQNAAYDFSAFIKFVATTHRIPAELKKNCDWQYAIIKIKTNAQNEITDYQVLNEATEPLKKSFAFLKGYQFGAIDVHQKSIVFFFTIENLNDDCNGPVPHYTPSDVMGKILAVMDQQSKQNPKTIFIYQPIISALYPTVK